MSEERATEILQVKLPSPLEIANLRDLPGEIIRCVAETANTAGLEGKRLDGISFVNERFTLPEITLKFSWPQETPTIG